LEDKLASGAGISVGEVVLVVFIVVQAVVAAKEEINNTDVIFFIFELLFKVKILNLTKNKNYAPKNTHANSRNGDLFTVVQCEIREWFSRQYHDERRKRHH